MLLDTCALLWLAEGAKRLGEEARSRIATEPLLYISAITGFEIGIKVSKRKLTLPVPPAAWLEAVLDHHGIAVVPLSLEVCVAATELPPIHGDPCDRFIIATAALNRWPVATADRVFQRYGIEVVW